MAEILGIGLSHYPGPLAPAKFWPQMLLRNVEVGRIKPELFADKSRWPAEMLAEWSDDDGAAAAELHRDRLVRGYQAIQAELEAFEPDLVLIWGDDQYENFKSDCIPAFCVGIFDTVTSKPYGTKVLFKTEENAWGVPIGTELPVNGHPAAAGELCRYLIEQQFDIAYSLDVRHTNGLAHSFNNTIVFLDYERRGAGFRYPVIPFHINCYGNELIKTAGNMSGEGSNRLSPPAPTPKRCFDMGAACARFFAESPWRVAIIGSASWSHGSLTTKHGRLHPDLETDGKRLGELRSGRFNTWGDLSTAEIVDAGEHELLNWIALAGAMTQVGQSAEVLDYVPSHIFNSSKCFAVFPPQNVAYRNRERLEAAR